MHLPSALLGLLLTASLSAMPVTSPSAGDEGWQSFGVRFGVSVTQKDEYFHQYDLYAAYGLPWHWRAASGWGVTTQFNVSAGVLHGGNTNGFVGSFGPGVTIDKRGRGLAFEVGPDFVVLSRETFRAQDFGGLALFQGHASLSYVFDNGLGIGYRAQHTSNAGMYTPNLGYDLHMAVLSWHF